MTRIIILHTNDIHGRIEGLARVATLVDEVRAENPDAVVLYLDAGDVEDTSTRLSNLTKGAAMHRLLSIAGCAASTVGNAALPRYGPDVLARQADAAAYPLLLANFRIDQDTPIPGTQASMMLTAGPVRLGVVGVTADAGGYTIFHKLVEVPLAGVIRREADRLRAEGAGAVILLSHLGLEPDRQIAGDIQDVVDVIIGAHSHDLLPEGEWVGKVLIAQAGNYAEHVGRVELVEQGGQISVGSASVMGVTDAVEPSPRVLQEAARLEQEIEHFLNEVVGELAGPLDYAEDRECGVADLMADILRERYQADVGLVCSGFAFAASLPAGPLRRVTLWDASPGTGNPGVVTMSGDLLKTLIERGLDPEQAARRPRGLRGQAVGLMHLSGASVRDGQVLVAGEPLDPARRYRVAGSDGELDTPFGYTDAGWDLRPEFDTSVILREAAEAYLADHRPVTVTMGRLG